MTVTLTSPCSFDGRKYKKGINELPEYIYNSFLAAGRCLPVKVKEFVEEPKKKDSNIIKAEKVLAENDIAISDAMLMTVAELSSLKGIGEKTAEKFLNQ